MSKLYEDLKYNIDRFNSYINPTDKLMYKKDFARATSDLWFIPESMPTIKVPMLMPELSGGFAAQPQGPGYGEMIRIPESPYQLILKMGPGQIKNLTIFSDEYITG